MRLNPDFIWASFPVDAILLCVGAVDEPQLHTSDLRSGPSFS